jgi:hypothetical protein
MARLAAVLAILAGLALVGYALFGRETDEERIRSKLAALSRAVHVDEDTGTNPIFRGTSLRGAFQDLFEARVTYRIPELGSDGQGTDSLVQLALRGTTGVTTFDVDFSSVEVTIAAGGALADVRTTAKLQAFRGGTSQVDSRKVRFDFGKSQGDWKITRFAVTPKDEEPTP